MSWQGALAAGGLNSFAYCGVAIFSIISGYFDWWPIITITLVVTGYLVVIKMIPLFLNLSRSFYIYILALLFLHVCVTITSFALHYMASGVIGPNGDISSSFYDSIYFSITTFTTLGYGDFQPLPARRLSTSSEALIGMLSMAVCASIIWLWCQENLISKEMAFLDGYRRRKGSIQTKRIRVRTFLGKYKRLDKWTTPPNAGDKFQYDSEKREWIPFKEDKISSESDNA